MDVPQKPINDATPESKPTYQKPQTSLFLDPKKIEGGTQSMPESNSGVLS